MLREEATEQQIVAAPSQSDNTTQMPKVMRRCQISLDRLPMNDAYDAALSASVMKTKKTLVERALGQGQRRSALLF